MSDLQVRNAKKRDAPYKLFDGGGLYLEVSTAGAKHWRMKYRQPTGKDNKLHFGSYPAVSLSQARERRDAARRQLAEGIDPGEARNAKGKVGKDADRNTFEAIAREWHSKNLAKWMPRTAANILHRLEVDIFPAVGKIQVSQVTIPPIR